MIVHNAGWWNNKWNEMNNFFIAVMNVWLQLQLQLLPVTLYLNVR